MRTTWGGRGLLAAVAVLAGAGAAAAQTTTPGPFVYKPIDAQKLVVGPADTGTGLASRALQSISRGVAGLVDNNGYVKTLNNLFGKRMNNSPPTQPGFSPLPPASSFQSTKYPNLFVPTAPTTMQYGKSVPVPGGK